MFEFVKKFFKKKTLPYDNSRDVNTENFSDYEKHIYKMKLELIEGNMQKSNSFETIVRNYKVVKAIRNVLRNKGFKVFTKTLNENTQEYLLMIQKR